MNRESGIGKFISLTFGSDEVAHYTAEYSWNSNQIAHIMMGFFLASVWIIVAMAWRKMAQAGEFDAKNDGWLKRRLLGIARFMARVPLDISVTFLFLLLLIKEGLDMLLDLSSFGESMINPNWERLRFDAVTDIGHWWTGMFVSALIVGTVTGLFKGLRFCYRPIIAASGLAACLIFLLAYARPMWQEQKSVFDRSELPGNYTRLVVLANGTKDGITFASDSPVNWEKLEEFRAEVVNAKDRPPARHYVIFGSTRQDRTKLAVAMGCEHAFRIREVLREANRQFDVDKPHRVRYVTATTLMERVTLLEKDLLDHQYLDCVVIDDVDVSMPLPTDASPEEYLQTLKKRIDNRPDRTPVMSKKVLKQFGLTAGPQSRIDPKSGLVQLNRASIVDFQKQLDSYPPDWWDPISTDRLAAKRQEVLIDIGKKAKEHEISTIWVLAGRTEGMDPKLLEDWKKQRGAWLKEIADILDVEESELRRIELIVTPNSK